MHLVVDFTQQLLASVIVQKAMLLLDMHDALLITLDANPVSPHPRPLFICFQKAGMLSKVTQWGVIMSA